MRKSSLSLHKIRLPVLALSLSIAGECAAQKPPPVASPVDPPASQESVPLPTAPLRPDAVRDAAPPPVSKAEPIPEIKFPGLTIHARERCIDVDATVCLDEGALELIACTKGSKEHESVIAVGASTIHIHTALLLLGAKNGSPPMRQPINDEATRWIDVPPKGDLIEVCLEFKDAAGKLTERPISDFITRSAKHARSPGAVPPEGDQLPRFPGTFIFAGSLLIDNGPGPKAYLAERSGHVISIATFGDELLCLPEVHSQDNGALMWSIDPTHLPKKGTAVTLRLRLKENPVPKPEPKSKSKSKP
jgi:hypothetical protein